MNKPINKREELINKIEKKENSKLKSGSAKSTLSWLGTIGIVGWMIILPMIGGIMAGVWIDKKYPSKYSWTLMLMIGGLFFGCWNAGLWLKKNLNNKF